MPASPTPREPSMALYQAILDEAVAGGGALMGRLVAAVGRSLYARELTTRSVYERDSMVVAGKLLQSKAPDLVALYPDALRRAFANPESGKKSAPRAIADLHFDQLELMDEAQVQTSVVLARAQQVTLHSAQASLAELNTLICSAQGLKTVRPESNPLRPEAYVNALNDVVEQMQLPAAVRLDWLATMSDTLGTELHSLYVALANQLRAQGVVAAAYAVSQAPLGMGVGMPGSVARDVRPALAPSGPMPTRAAAPQGLAASPAAAPAEAPQWAAPPAPVRGEDDALLTLDKLRRLLAGELDAPVAGDRMQAFAQQFARQFERGDAPPMEPVTDFASTVPAAFEALAEMQQVDQVVQRLERRNAPGFTPGTADGDSSVEGIRDVLRRSASGVAQALSLEVVTLMVDNIRHNPRLLEPIQRLIAELEPALLLLSLVDPRFFTDKQHPARALLQEITSRSLAYETVQSSGFSAFLDTLVQAVEPLASATIESAEPFERVLAELHTAWQLAAQDRDRARTDAVQALQHAEQRNLLAEKIARGIESHPDSAQVPEAVIDFLCGPWAQVVAQARIAAGANPGAADKYQALISAMLWSAHPESTRKNIAKLTRLVPLLLNTLREGLDTIHYPATQTSAFLETLMGLHQAAFRSANKAAAGAAPNAAVVAPEPTPAAPVATVRAPRGDAGDPWVAPAEAKASNFMEWPETPPVAHAAAQPTEPDALVDATGQELPLGSWVELLAHDKWVRTQLTWASPHGTLFLFTSVFGTTQSMTRRSLDKLVASGHLRMVSGQTMVDGALDAVAQIALRNSMDITP